MAPLVRKYVQCRWLLVVAKILSLEIALKIKLLTHTFCFQIDEGVSTARLRNYLELAQRGTDAAHAPGAPCAVPVDGAGAPCASAAVLAAGTRVAVVGHRAAPGAAALGATIFAGAWRFCSRYSSRIY